MKTATDIAELIVIEADHGEGIYPIVTGSRLIKEHAIEFAHYIDVELSSYAKSLKPIREHYIEWIKTIEK